MDASTRQLCLEGTRVDVKMQLFNLLSRRSDSLHCEVIWLIGLAGSGKSTLLNTIAEDFRRLRRCGAFIFFDRSDPVNSDPHRVIPTLAYHLARFSIPFAERLHEQIRARQDILESSQDAQFQTLLAEPSKAVTALANHPLIVIIIDGLDECGTEESRRGLFEIFTHREAAAPVSNPYRQPRRARYSFRLYPVQY
jgi:NACHT domain